MQQRLGQLLGSPDRGRSSATRVAGSRSPRRRATSGPRAPAGPDWRDAWRRRHPASSSTGMRLVVATAAPVTMLVAPGPTEVVHAKALQPIRHARVADRRCAPWPARYARGSSEGRRRSRAAPVRDRPRCRGRRCRSSRRRIDARTPSRSTDWTERKRTSAWATVSLTCVAFAERHRQPRVDVLLAPRVAYPGVGRDRHRRPSFAG